LGIFISATHNNNPSFLIKKDTLMNTEIILSPVRVITRSLVRRTPNSKVFKSLVNASFAASLAVLIGCSGSLPTLGGGSKSNVSGAAAGTTAEGEDSSLEKCDSSLGTLRLYEDTRLAWWGHYRRYYPNLGSTIPVIRMMIQQSNCFVIVERGQAMAAMTQERALMNSGELRDGSNFGKGQMVAADYTLSPSIQFSQKKNGGVSGFFNKLTRRAGGLVSGRGSVQSNEASTTLLLIENRSGVQVSAAEGSAKNFDFSVAGLSLGGNGFAGIGGVSAFTDTPEGKVIMAAFADSYNKMVRALRNYKPQAVEGGLGKGGKLKVGGADDPMPKAKQSKARVEVTQPVAQPKPVVRQTQGTTRVNVNRNANIRIDAFDEDALNDYYDGLKSAVTFMSSFASFTPEQVKQFETRNMGGQWWMAWSGIVTGKLQTSKIELESWPLSAKQQGWDVLGKKILKYNKLFEQHRENILANEAFESRIRNSIANFELVTQESLFAE
jgi:curli production assembly/transport component CsgG